MNGNQYEGEFNQGRVEGQGVYKWVDGSTYHGQWLNGQKDDYGIWTSADRRESYVGMWQENKANGKGTYM